MMWSHENSASALAKAWHSLAEELRVLASTIDHARTGVLRAALAYERMAEKVIESPASAPATPENRGAALRRAHG